MKNIAFLTSGGDAPGMNACIRAIVKTATLHNLNSFAIYDGYKGMINGQISPISEQEVEFIGHRGGTIIGSARSKEFLDKNTRKVAIENLKKNKIDALITVGGDGTFAGALKLSDEMDIPVIAIPGTIDNDIYGTERTIGFDTALNTVVASIDKIRDTALSHHRTFLVEVMGKNSGFIAVNAAFASGVNTVLIPERNTNFSAVIERVKQNYTNRLSTIIIVAEGDDFGKAIKMEEVLKQSLPDIEFKTTVLGHLQRGGDPSAMDRILATKMGILAVELLLSGESKVMTASKGDDIFAIPIETCFATPSNWLEEKSNSFYNKLLSLN